MYRPTMVSSYIPLPTELQHHNKGLINLINNDNECLRWCNIRYLNPKDNHPKRIKRSDKLVVDPLNYERVEFPVSVKDYAKIEAQNDINIKNINFLDMKTKNFTLFMCPSRKTIC